MEFQITRFQYDNYVHVSVFSVDTLFRGYTLEPGFNNIHKVPHHYLPEGRYKVQLEGMPKFDKQDSFYTFNSFQGHITLESLNGHLRSILWAGSNKQYPTRHIVLMDDLPDLNLNTSFEKHAENLYTRPNNIYRNLYDFVIRTIRDNILIELEIKSLPSLLAGKSREFFPTKINGVQTPLSLIKHE